MSDGARRTFDARGHWQAGGTRPRSLAALPRLIAGGVGLARRAGPRAFWTLIACQAATALLLGAQVGLGKIAIERILAGTGRGGDLSGAVLPVVGLAVATALAGFVAAAVVQVQRGLGERVSQLTWRSILDVTSSVDLADFEDPAFFDDVQRVRVNALVRPLTMTTGVAQLLSGLLSSVAVTVALLVLAPLLVPALVVAVLPLLALAGRSGRLEFAFIAAQTPTSRVRDYLQMVLTGREEAQEVRAFDLGAPLEARWQASADRYLAALDRHVLRRVRLAMLSAGATGIATGLSLGVLLWMLGSERLSLSSAAVALFAVRALATQLQVLFGGVTQLFESSLFVDDLERFLERAPRPSLPAAGTAPARLEELRLEAVGFTYPGSGRPALRDVDLVLRRGETVALVGVNGSGKTTLAKLMAQLFDPSSGRLLWNGRDVTGLDRRALRAAVGVIFQDYVRYQLSVGENIELGRVEAAGDAARLEEAARRGGASGLVRSLPEGFDTQLGKEFTGGYDLSGGQWQRVALSRAFFRDAELLVLDEPTAAMDAQAEHEVFEHVRDLAAGKTLLLISHRFSTVKSADRIYVLDGGRVLEHGSHDELMAAGGRYAELFELQARAYR